MSRYKGLSAYERDEELETKIGIEVDFGSGLFIRVLRAGGSNGKFGRAYARITKPYQRMMNANTLPEDTENRLYAELYADTVIVGWRGMIDQESGEEIPFNREEVIAFLIAVPEAFSILRNSAESIDSFRRSEVQEESGQLGNS